jgi:hypothetical protein
LFRSHAVLYHLVIGFLESKLKTEAASQILLAVKMYSGHSNYLQEVPRQMTGLHLAAYFGVYEVVNTLIRRGQSMDLKDSYGRTPLSWAVGNGHEAVVKLLLEKGAGLETKSNNGRTPLLWAAENGCVDDADGPRAALANDRPLLNHVCPPSDLNNDGYNQDPPEAVQFLEPGGTSSFPHRLDTTEHASSKRKQTLQDGRASKRTHFEPADTAGGAWSGADTRVSAAVLIQRAWRSREQAKAWRRYRHKVILIQSLWRGKQACLAYDEYRHNIILVQSLWRGRSSTSRGGGEGSVPVRSTMRLARQWLRQRAIVYLENGGR